MTVSLESDPERSIGFLVNDIGRLMRREFNRRTAARELSLAQWRVLATLSRQEGVNQVCLADRLEIQPMTLARQLDRLEAAGLVVRRQDMQDRRAMRLYLTAAAQPLVAEMRTVAARIWDEVLHDFDAAEREVLIDSLRGVKRGLMDLGDRLSNLPLKATDTDD